MNKKLGRLLQPNMGGYLIVMLGFALAAALFGNYILSAVELVITAVVFALHRVNKTNRRKNIYR